MEASVSPGGLRLGAIAAAMLGLATALSLADPVFGAASDRFESDLWASAADGVSADAAAAALALLACTLAAILLKPLLLVGALFLIERRIGPADREAKDFRTAWLVQIAFLTAGYLAWVALSRLLPLAETPLLRIDAEAAAPLRLAAACGHFLLAVFLADLLHYWSHRAHHRFALLWRFHAVHHCARDLDVVHSFSHPLESVTRYFLVWIPLGLLTGFDSGQLYLLAGFFILQTKLNHMNVPIHAGRFGLIIADNRYHFVHHSRDPTDHDRNFAEVFPVLDMVFGTYRAPRAGPLPATGLADRPPPATLRDYLLAKPGR